MRNRGALCPTMGLTTIQGAGHEVRRGKRSCFQIVIILWTLNVLSDVIKGSLRFHRSIVFFSQFTVKSLCPKASGEY